MTIAATSLIDAAPEDAGVSSRGLERLSRVVRGHIEARHIPGAITAVVRDNRVIHFETYGSMDLEAGKPMAPDTIFRIYSMTKPIASVALMMLYEEGRFQLDDAVSQYIPELGGLRVYVTGPSDAPITRAASREPTVREVLSHSGGIGSGNVVAHPVVAEMFRTGKATGIPAQGTLREMIANIGKMPLMADPGSEWIYSMSTDIVARLVEVLSGESFDTFLRSRIFEPLGMVDTAFYITADKRDRFAANYRSSADGTCQLFDAPATSQWSSNGTYFSGVGGLTSTAPDYIRFARMLANGGELDGARILGPRTVAYMASNHLPGGKDIFSMVPSGTGPASEQPGTGFGLGFAVLIDPAASQTLGSKGEYYWSGAASTQFFVSPADGLVALFMTQLMQTPYQFRRELRTTVYSALTS